MPAVGLREKFTAYAQLTKPRIVLLFALTGLATMVLEGSLLADPARFWLIVLGITLTASSANAFNQYIDRDIDAVMERTSRKRPLPQGRLTPAQALSFAYVTGIAAMAVLYGFGNALAAFFGFFTIAFYVLVYTMWLKCRTPYNIVIGGAAGATGPLIGWAAASGSVSLTAWALFLVIFMWTPPHFWALALCVKDEYAKASVPMLPVTAGEEATRKQIFWYAVALIPLTFVPAFFAGSGWLYVTGAAALGVEFIRRAVAVKRRKTREAYWGMFGYSIVYLLALFILLMVDALIAAKPVHAAEKIPMELQGVGIVEKLGAQVDLDLKFRDETGAVVPLRKFFDAHKPVALMLAYYGCPNLCNFFLNGATESLKNLKWMPGREFQAVTVSFDPREEPMLAARKKASHLKLLDRAGAENGWHFLVSESKAGPEDPNNAKTLAEQVGFKYRFDKAQSQYAHAAAMIFLTPQGKVSRYLYGIEFKEKDLRLALSESSGNKIGTVVDRLLLFCYNYDPKTRKYSLYAMNLMRASAGVTVLALGTWLLAFRRRGRREEKARDNISNSPEGRI